MNPIHIRITFVLFVFTLFFSPKINATHIVGGDLSYECLGNNEYLITMRVYRDCYLGQAGFDDPATMRIFTGINGNTPFGSLFLVDLTQESDIPPVVSNPCLMPPSNVCVEEGLYQRIVTLAIIFLTSVVVGIIRLAIFLIRKGQEQLIPFLSLEKLNRRVITARLSMIFHPS